MSKIRKNLDRQLTIVGLIKDAKEVEIIYNYLMETDNAIWGSKWNILVHSIFEGYPSSLRTYKLTDFGKIFLNGLLCKKEIK